jgi:hypothetical protein
VAEGLKLSTKREHDTEMVVKARHNGSKGEQSNVMSSTVRSTLMGRV